MPRDRKDRGKRWRLLLLVIVSAILHFAIAVIVPSASIKSLHRQEADSLTISFRKLKIFSKHDFGTTSKSTISAPKRADQIKLPHSSDESNTTLSNEYYYRARELDVLPQVAQPLEPEYPLQAKENGITGYVKLELFIDEQGKVVNVDVLESTPAEIFDSASIKAFANKAFLPGKIKSFPVKSRIITTIRFEESSSTANP